MKISGKVGGERIDNVSIQPTPRATVYPVGTSNNKFILIIIVMVGGRDETRNILTRHQELISHLRITTQREPPRGRITCYWVCSPMTLTDGNQDPKLSHCAKGRLECRLAFRGKESQSEE